MNRISKLLPYEEISTKWTDSNLNSESARVLTMEQVEAFENIVKEDEAWETLLVVFNKGRDVDAWLAMDWPDGFDELLLCVPLCRLVEFECNKCTVGKRQENNSCANDNSLFGYIAELLKVPDRTGLLDHIDNIKKILLSEEIKWNIFTRKIE